MLGGKCSAYTFPSFSRAQFDLLNGTTTCQWAFESRAVSLQWDHLRLVSWWCDTESTETVSYELQSISSLLRSSMFSNILPLTVPAQRGNSILGQWQIWQGFGLRPL